jgi:phage-related protein
MYDGTLKFDTAIDRSGFETGLSKLGSIAKTGMKAVVAAVGAAATATVILGKQALSAYADYEQLVGGTKLLFDDASDYILEKSKSAYKEVQLSQSDYLEQANGFATGLKTSMNGNAQAAAELADKIIKAEADVVAATGQTQENVQNAFNGIMKSNFTMLDNLQLGITPTKAGFQEVIDKVNEWNAANGRATDYQLANLADCQQALVDYIEMQGLAGYAGKESADTISGSVAMLKAAWDNVLVGIADDTQDFDRLMDALVESATAVFKNFKPRIGTIASGIGKLIRSIADEIIDSFPALATNLSDLLMKAYVLISTTLAKLIPAIIDTFPEIVQMLADGFFETLPILTAIMKEYYTNLFAYTIQVLTELLPVVTEALPDMIIAIVDALVSLMPTVLDGAVQLFTALIDAIPIIIEELVPRVPEIVAEIIMALLECSDKLLEASTTLFWELVKGLGKAAGGLTRGLVDLQENLFASWKKIGSGLVDKVKNTAREIIFAMINGIASLPQKMGESGANIIYGLWNGMWGKVGWLKERIFDLGNELVENFKETFGIHSPSAVMRDKVGKYLAQGIGVGFTDEMPKVNTEIDNSALAAVSRLNLTESFPKPSPITGGGLNYVSGGSSPQEIVINAKFAVGEEVVAEGVTRLVTDEVDKRQGVDIKLKERGLTT